MIGRLYCPGVWVDESWRFGPSFAAVDTCRYRGPGSAGGGSRDCAAPRALHDGLGNARSDSGVVDARGTMDYEWGETCDGWTIEQRYRLKMRYAETADVDIVSSFVTWELKDGLRYRFNQKQTRNGEVDQEIRGEARLDGPARAELPNSRNPSRRP